MSNLMQLYLGSFRLGLFTVKGFSYNIFWLIQCVYVLLNGSVFMFLLKKKSKKVHKNFNGFVKKN